MPRAHTHLAVTGGLAFHPDAVEARPLRGRHLNCAHCDHPLECVEQNRRSGTWLGSFMCPNCRSEYFYAYRWGRLLPKC
jgi:hypothetical protein